MVIFFSKFFCLQVQVQANFFSSFDFIFSCVLQLGTCFAEDANPAANITWLKNNRPLVADGKGVYSLFCWMIINVNKTALLSADIYKYYIPGCIYSL